MTMAEAFSLVLTSVGLTISALTLVIYLIVVISKKK